MLSFATQLMPRRDAPMRALAANAGAHFPLIVRSRFCLCLSRSAFLPFEGVLSDLSMHHWHGLLPRPCPAGGSPASAYPALELVPRRSPRLSMRALASSAVYGVNFYGFANGCFICRWLARPRVPTCEAPMGFGPSLHRSRLQPPAAGKKGARCRAMTDAHRQ